MKKLAIIFVMFASLSTTAQVSIGPRAGANFSTFKDAPGVSSISGVTAGATFLYQFVDFFGVSVDALYSAEGAKYEATIDQVRFQYKSRLNYLRVPVLANVFIGPVDSKVRGRVMLGPSLGFLMSVKSEIEIAGFNAEIGMDKSDFKSVDFGAIAGGGLDFKLNDRMWLNVDGRYYFGSSKVFDVDMTAVNDVKNNCASVTVGMGFILGK